MARPVTTQWDFGESFSPARTRKVWSLTELTTRIRRLLEAQIGQLWVAGEVSNLRVQTSGHIYFTLKDSAAQLNCVLFRSELGANREVLQDGQRVILQGDLTVYEARGQYQLRVNAVELQGLGNLQAAFERLKQKLAGEGLFALERKRPMPRFPARIGLITSPTGAAIRDVIHGLQRRSPCLEIILAPCRVQGEGAANELAAAIRLLNSWSAALTRGPGSDPGNLGLDLILVTRGGGSLEDLWAFNEEVVARAIFASALPVMSAVGHEIDITISDLVADVRAATPSTAAQILSEGYCSSRAFLEVAAQRLRQRTQRGLATRADELRHALHRLGRVHPRRWLDEQFQRADDLQTLLWERLQHRWRQSQAAWQLIHQRFARVHLSQRLKREQDGLSTIAKNLVQRTRHGFEACERRLNCAEDRLRLLSPNSVLERGYSITMDALTHRVIRAAEEVADGQRLRTRLKQSEVFSIVSPPDDSSHPPGLSRGPSNS